MSDEPGDEWHECVQAGSEGSTHAELREKSWSVFACHSKQQEYSEKAVRYVKTCLELKGHKVFFDRDDLVHISLPALEAAIAKSCIFVLFLDDLTLNSQWCPKEINLAVKHNTPIHVVIDQDKHRIKELIDHCRASGVPEVYHLFGDNSKQAIPFSWDLKEVQESALRKLEAAIQASIKEVPVPATDVRVGLTAGAGVPGIVSAVVRAIGPEGHSPNDVQATFIGGTIENITNSLRGSICVVNKTEAVIEIAVEKQFWTDTSSYARILPGASISRGRKNGTYIIYFKMEGRNFERTFEFRCSKTTVTVSPNRKCAIAYQ